MAYAEHLRECLHPDMQSEALELRKNVDSGYPRRGCLI